jgi:hypothetical protein
MIGMMAMPHRTRTSIAHIALHGLQCCAILSPKKEKDGMPPTTESQGDAH